MTKVKEQNEEFEIVPDLKADIISFETIKIKPKRIGDGVRWGSAKPSLKEEIKIGKERTRKAQRKQVDETIFPITREKAKKRECEQSSSGTIIMHT